MDIRSSSVWYEHARDLAKSLEDGDVGFECSEADLLVLWPLSRERKVVLIAG